MKIDGLYWEKKEHTSFNATLESAQSQQDHLTSLSLQEITVLNQTPTKNCTLFRSSTNEIVQDEFVQEFDGKSFKSNHRLYDLMASYIINNISF